MSLEVKTLPVSGNPGTGMAIASNALARIQNNRSAGEAAILKQQMYNSDLVHRKAVEERLSKASNAQIAASNANVGASKVQQRLAETKLSNIVADKKYDIDQRKIRSDILKSAAIDPMIIPTDKRPQAQADISDWYTDTLSDETNKELNTLHVARPATLIDYTDAETRAALTVGERVDKMTKAGDFENLDIANTGVRRHNEDINLQKQVADNNHQQQLAIKAGNFDLYKNLRTVGTNLNAKRVALDSPLKTALANVDADTSGAIKILTNNSKGYKSVKGKNGKPFLISTGGEAEDYVVNDFNNLGRSAEFRGLLLNDVLKEFNVSDKDRLQIFQSAKNNEGLFTDILDDNFISKQDPRVQTIFNIAIKTGKPINELMQDPAIKSLIKTSSSRNTTTKSLQAYDSLIARREDKKQAISKSYNAEGISKTEIKKIKDGLRTPVSTTKTVPTKTVTSTVKKIEEGTNSSSTKKIVDRLITKLGKESTQIEKDQKLYTINDSDSPLVRNVKKEELSKIADRREKVYAQNLDIRNAKVKSILDRSKTITTSEGAAKLREELKVLEAETPETTEGTGFLETLDILSKRLENVWAHKDTLSSVDLRDMDKAVIRNNIRNSIK